MLASSISVSEVIGSDKLLTRLVSSEIDVSDVLSRIVAPIYEVVLSSNVDVTDSINTQKEIERLLIESIVIIDEVLTDKELVRLLSENIDLVDVIARTIILAPQTYNRILSDSLAIQDIILRETTGQLVQLILFRLAEIHNIELGISDSDIRVGIEVKNIDIDLEEL